MDKEIKFRTGAFIQAYNQMKCKDTPFGFIDAEDFQIPFSEIKPPESYKPPMNEATGKSLPDCCNFHKSALEHGKKWFRRFPNCCNPHKAMIGKWWFNKSNYNGLPDKIINQLAYTELHISAKIEKSDWYEDITDYINYNIESFGHPRIGADRYLGNLQLSVGRKDCNFPKEKQDRLLEFIEKSLKQEKVETTDLNLLYSTYKKWLNLFPFELSYFSGLREQFEKSLPILKGNPVENRYTGNIKTKILIEPEFVDSLIRTTKRLLDKVKVAELLENELKSDLGKHQLNLENESLRVDTAKITKEYSKGELKYVKTLKKWLTRHKKYFEKVADLMNKKSENQEKPNESAMRTSDKGTGKFYSDSDFVSLIEEILKLEMFQVNDFLEYHYSLSFYKDTMSKLNWFTALRKNLMHYFPEIEKKNLPMQIQLAWHWEDKKSKEIVVESFKRQVQFSNKNPEKKSAEEIAGIFTEMEKSENLFWKGVPMVVVVNHFKVLSDRKSKNGKPFLTQEQLIQFFKKAFLKNTELPKQKLNYANGEKGFVIKRFYEFFDLSVSKYQEVNKKFKYIKLISSNFDNWKDDTIEPFFKPNKAKENW